MSPSWPLSDKPGGITWGLEASLHACFQGLISISLKSNLTDSNNVLKQLYFPESSFITAAELPGEEHSYFLPGLCWSFAASGKSCTCYQKRQ